MDPPYSDHTSLHLAATLVNSIAAQLLLDKRVNVEARSKYSATPLLLAAEGDRERDTTAVLQFLLQRGADIKAKGRWGEMVFEVALRGREANMKLLLKARDRSTSARRFHIKSIKGGVTRCD